MKPTPSRRSPHSQTPTITQTQATSIVDRIHHILTVIMQGYRHNGSGNAILQDNDPDFTNEIIARGVGVKTDDIQSLRSFLMRKTNPIKAASRECQFFALNSDQHNAYLDAIKKTVGALVTGETADLSDEMKILPKIERIAPIIDKLARVQAKSISREL